MLWLRAHLTYANVAATLALVLAASGFAVASIPNSRGVIRACYARHGGALRTIDKAKKGAAGHCRKNERAVSWNQKGQPGVPGGKGAQGAAGALGAQGAQGAQGVAGVAGAQGAR